MAARDTCSPASPVDYQLMVESITDSEVIMVGPDGSILTWSDSATRQKGYHGPEVIGRNISIFSTREDLAAGTVQRELALATQSGRFEGEGWRTRKDGSRFWAEVVLQAMRTPDGELAGLLSITRDLTEQQARDQRLAVAALMLDSITDYEVILLGVDGTIRSWNRAAERLKGYTADEVLGRNVSIFYQDDDVATGLADRELREALESGRVEVEGWRIRKDRTRFWANVVISPVRDGDAQHVGFVKVTRDLTERVEREKLLQRQRDDILELSTPVMQVWDRVLALPVIGTLDSTRAAHLTESLLQRIASDEAAIVILDISGVPMIDTAVAQHLFKTIQGARLMGAESIISGVRPETAQAMVHLGIEMGEVRSRSTLRGALQLAFAILAERGGVGGRSLDGAPPGVDRVTR